VDTLLDLDNNYSDLKNLPDEELVLFAKESKDASETLIARYLKLILIKSEIYANSATDSDDLRQEGLISLLKAISSYDPAKGVKFATFAEVCIENRMRTVRARRGDYAKIPESLEDVSEYEKPSDSETPESIFLYKELVSELRKNVESELSSAERRTFDLCMQGLSYRSAAEKLGVSEKAVDNAMQRARRKLRALVSK